MLARRDKFSSQGRNKGNRKPSLECHSNDFCRQDPLINAKLKKKKKEEEVVYWHSLKVLPPKYLLITIVILSFVHKFYGISPCRRGSLIPTS